MESLYNNVAGLKACSFIKKRPRHGWILRNFKNIILKNIFTAVS